MDTKKRKELLSEYKDKPVIGGVYCIECKGNSRKWIKSTTDIEGAKNRFAFTVKTKACPEPAMRREWNEFGIDSFDFHVLEELKKKNSQTEKEFAADVNTLYEIWIEKYNN